MVAVTVYTPGVSATTAPVGSIWATAAPPVAATAHSTGTSGTARPAASFALNVKRTTSPVRTALDAGSTASRDTVLATTCRANWVVAGPAFAEIVARPGAPRPRREGRNPGETAAHEAGRIDAADVARDKPLDGRVPDGLPAGIERTRGELHPLADLDFGYRGGDLDLRYRERRRRRRLLQQQGKRDRDMHANSLWYNMLWWLDLHDPQP